MALSGACGGGPRPGAAPASPAGGDAGALLVVDCLLPGEVRQLGRHVTYATPRRATKTSASDCEIRGGEYVAYDRADYATALRVWLPEAEAGDPTAETYVGEIYEKGLGLAPDYALAASWYRRAADRGHARAQINLGQLYERGLGVPRDPDQALDWYRRASGLQAAELPFLPSAPPLGDGAEPRDAETEALRGEVERLQSELARLRAADAPRDARSDRGVADAARRALESERGRLEAERSALEQESRHLAGQRERLDADASGISSIRSELGRQSEQLEGREQDLEARTAGLGERETALAEREQAFDTRSEELRRREQELERLRREAEAKPASPPSDAPEAELPSPAIQLIEPPLPPTRGIELAAAISDAGQRLVVGRVEAPAGLLALTVNGLEATTDERGIFQHRVEVASTGTEVSIVAVDRQGKRAARTFRLAPAEREAPRPKRASAPLDVELGDFHALVIGNDEYLRLPDLATARNDARAVAKLLRERYGFEVQLLLDASRYDTLAALNGFRARLDENDNFLLYYAGHGELDEVNARGHWLPVDAEPDSSANWVSNVTITDILNAMSARHVLVVADSCYSGALTRSALARLDAGMSDAARAAWLSAMATKRSRVALTSGALAPVLDSGGGGHSVFARVFLDVLEENEDFLEGARLHGELAARVAWAAQGSAFEQIPQYAPIKFAGHEAGDFVFRPAR